MSREAFEVYLGLARQLGESKAETTFLRVSTTAGWSLADLDEATGLVLEEMRGAARAALASSGYDLGEARRQEIQTATEDAFRARIAALMSAAVPEGSRAQ